MARKKPNWSKWREKLHNVYRFQIVDEKSYDVKLVVELNRLNVIIGAGLTLAFFTLINFIFIAYTPLKQYIPGYGSTTGRKEVVKMSMKAEELDEKVSATQKYITNLQNILNDKIVVDAVPSTLKKTKVDSGILNIKTVDEAKFVQEVEKGLKNAELLASVQDSKTSVLSNLVVAKPVAGEILSPYIDTKPSISFSASENEPIKAVLSGNVIFTGKSEEDGEFIAVQAENQLVYILKNNSQLLKKTGNFVNVGDTIAKAGKNSTTKKYMTVLELWYRGQPIDSQKFIK